MPVALSGLPGGLFTAWEIKLDTSGMEFLGVEWADCSETALICDRCGFVHAFAVSGVELRDPGKG